MIQLLLLLSFYILNSLETVVLDLKKFMNEKEEKQRQIDYLILFKKLNKNKL